MGAFKKNVGDGIPFASEIFAKRHWDYEGLKLDEKSECEHDTSSFHSHLQNTNEIIGNNFYLGTPIAMSYQ